MFIYSHSVEISKFILRPVTRGEMRRVRTNPPPPTVRRAPPGPVLHTALYDRPRFHPCQGLSTSLKLLHQRLLQCRCTIELLPFPMFPGIHSIYIYIYIYIWSGMLGITRVCMLLDVLRSSEAFFTDCNSLTDWLPG